MARVAHPIILCLSVVLLTAFGGPAQSSPADARPASQVNAFLSAPAASRTSGLGGRIDVFQVSCAGTLQQNFQTAGGPWVGWRDLGAPPKTSLTDSPSASWTSTGSRLDVFVIGLDGRLYQRTWTVGSGWSVWVDLGGALAIPGYPTASWTMDGGRIDVFAIDVNRKLVQLTWTKANGWSPWTDLHSPPVMSGGSPSATWTADGSRLDVFVTSTNQHVHQMFWTPSGWSTWVDLGGTLGTNPSASWTAPGTRLDVFGVDPHGRLNQLTWTSDAGWGKWATRPPPQDGAGSSPSATWGFNGQRLDVFVIARLDEKVYRQYWTATTGWTPWISVD
ncbi:hypothetical protein JOF56_000764 [Kibdelosporangium banguiense]|uniref:PLL-like beta propeller domain-containing protein n=1 Tax=Kibdelosporangium banguiense TaxID=1365924 RepID=A0ABS4T8W9_9PSEU|nr:hypothetical protein [Kibdelosporangium banguiense]MBP2320379.1 hypothetical protein [Kibdelosporangium banguiense]